MAWGGASRAVPPPPPHPGPWLPGINTAALRTAAAGGPGGGAQGWQVSAGPPGVPPAPPFGPRGEEGRGRPSGGPGCTATPSPLVRSRSQASLSPPGTERAPSSAGSTILFLFLSRPVPFPPALPRLGSLSPPRLDEAGPGQPVLRARSARHAGEGAGDRARKARLLLPRPAVRSPFSPHPSVPLVFGRQVLPGRSALSTRPGKALGPRRPLSPLPPRAL